VAAVVGALAPSHRSLPAAALVAATAAVIRWPILRWVALALLASALAQRSLDGLDGVHARVVAADVTLLSDPVARFEGVRADVRWGDRRLEAHAEGAAADALRPRLAGEVIALRGSVAPLDRGRPWLVARHVAGELTVLRVDGWRQGDPLSHLANGLRRTLVVGAAPLSDRDRSLYTGLVIGDDRDQPADLADSFRGAGLTHLLAVSGQNVAFALALAGPLLRRLRLWPRLVATLAVIGLFGVMTRFEPSVLRASAMAALGATLAMPGRPTPRLRVIGLAITGLLLVDPLLVRSVGFQLSACAALAIVVVAPPLQLALPGPPALREALAVTLAAQIGVAPVLLSTFGPIPVASLPANLLGVPVAGAVMVWGLTGGLVAGGVGAPWAGVLQIPTRLALAWLELVAERTAAAPLGELHAVHVAVVAVGVAVLASVRRTEARAVGAALVAATVLTAVVAAHAPVARRQALQPGAVRWHGGGTDVLVLGGAGRTTVGGASLLASLRRSGVRTVDLLVIADATVPEAVLEAIADAHRIGQVHDLSDGAATIEVGDLVVRIVAVPGRLVVDAVPRGP
jgi:competence protein ComEC